jgi:hypothetical protein
MAETGISTTTLTRTCSGVEPVHPDVNREGKRGNLANDRSTCVAIATINTLCAYFRAQPGDLFIYVEDA